VAGNEIHDFGVSFTPVGRNPFDRIIHYKGQDIRVIRKSFITNAYETIEPADAGIPVAEFIYADQEGRKSQVIADGESRQIGNLAFVFNTMAVDSQAILLSVSGDSLFFTAPFPVNSSGMGSESYRLLEAGEAHAFIPQQLYHFDDQVVVLNQFLENGHIIARRIPEPEGRTYDAVVLEVASGNENKEVILMGKAGYQGISREVELNGSKILISYGSLHKELPFNIQLNDFIVERYPGSQSPSSFESRVTLRDEERDYTGIRRIYMNNILKYRGYRFYQSSYDPDEKGTILSVNHDLAGTSITYTGYALMGLGMLLSLFNRNSRFRSLTTGRNKAGNILKTTMMLILIFLVNNSTRAQASPREPVPVDKEHASTFGKLLVQDNNGRIEPMNTLSSEVLRKLTRKSTYKGMDPDQVFLGMLINPSLWQHEPIIRATHPQIKELLRSKEEYYPFTSFFKEDAYILQRYAEAAFRKKPAGRSKFDNEIIRLDERVNICYLVFSGQFLRIFPVPGDSTRTWYNHEGIRGRIMTGDSVFADNIIYLYAQDVQKSMETGNWESPVRLLQAVANYQRKYAGDIIPSDRKVNTEVLLNKSDLLSRISRYYGITGFVLLILQFAGIFIWRFKLRIPVMIAMVLIAILFGLHTAGLGLRWYVSGHAPWSNGYEALTYVAWATVLAGLIFAFKSSITLSVTSILAFLILFVAHLSWMDPQITNLVPVLRSYWLVIHVATITASYGFLAMGALLGFINLLLIIFQTHDNRDYVSRNIQELTNTIEMSLTIGLYLLTIGVFLGAIWANESWGRYWGWDPKETWALVTVLVYAFILHMRMVPGLRGTYAFNLAALLGISTVILTYFGVNYYLSGLHSYAQGDPLPVPAFVYYTFAVIAVTAVGAYWKRDKGEETNEVPGSI
jgi:cytochrome c-type biogenesis protein CcsB